MKLISVKQFDLRFYMQSPIIIALIIYGHTKNKPEAMLTNIECFFEVQLLHTTMRKRKMYLIFELYFQCSERWPKSFKFSEDFNKSLDSKVAELSLKIELNSS